MIFSLKAFLWSFELFEALRSVAAWWFCSSAYWQSWACWYPWWPDQWPRQYLAWHSWTVFFQNRSYWLSYVFQDYSLRSTSQSYPFPFPLAYNSWQSHHTVWSTWPSTPHKSCHYSCPPCPTPALRLSHAKASWTAPRSVPCKSFTVGSASVRPVAAASIFTLLRIVNRWGLIRTIISVDAILAWARGTQKLWCCFGSLTLGIVTCRLATRSEGFLASCDLSFVIFLSCFALKLYCTLCLLSLSTYTLCLICLSSSQSLHFSHYPSLIDRLHIRFHAFYHNYFDLSNLPSSFHLG